MRQHLPRSGGQALAGSMPAGACVVALECAQRLILKVGAGGTAIKPPPT